MIGWNLLNADLPPLRPSQLAGLLDGDGCLHLRRERGRAGRPDDRYASVTLTMRDDDPAPILAATSLYRAVGRPIGSLSWHVRSGLVTWRVGRAEDVLALLELVPPGLFMSAKGHLRAGVLRDVAWSVLSGGRRLPEREERDRIAAHRATLAARLAIPLDVPLPLPPTVQELAHDEVCGYVQGLYLADGWTGIDGPRYAYRPIASLTQRIDALELLEELRRRTGLGRVYRVARPARGNEYAVWRLVGAVTAAAFASLLVSDGLPDMLPRAQAFALWHEAIAAHRAIPLADRRRGALRASALLDRYRDELRARTRYHGPHPLVRQLAPTRRQPLIARRP